MMASTSQTSIRVVFMASSYSFNNGEARCQREDGFSKLRTSSTHIAVIISNSRGRYSQSNYYSEGEILLWKHI